jgi:hypothetical protein
MSVEPHFRQYFCYMVVLFVLLEKTIDFYTITDNLYQVMMDALHPVEVYFTTRIYKWKAPITPYDNGHKLLRVKVNSFLQQYKQHHHITEILSEVGLYTHPPPTLLTV